MRNRHLREWKSSWTKEIKCGCLAAIRGSSRFTVQVEYELPRGDMPFSRHGAVEEAGSWI